QRGAAAARPGAQRTRVPAAGNAARGPGAAAVVVAADLPRGHRGGGHAVLPRRAVGDVDRRAQARGAGDGARRRPGRAGDPMSRRLRVAHTTGFTYESAVTGSFNEARLTPRSDARQNVIVNRVDTVPPTRPFRYTDYWGTAVTAFDVSAPHDALEVSSYSVVETEPAASAPQQGCDWARLRSEHTLDTFAELLEATAYVPEHEELR